MTSEGIGARYERLKTQNGACKDGIDGTMNGDEEGGVILGVHIRVREWDH